MYLLSQPSQPKLARSMPPRSVWQSARTSFSQTAHHRQPGDGALASKFPPHSAQFEADPWHHPVPSIPQSPQSASNLQQPPPPPPERRRDGTGAERRRGGDGGEGAGAGCSRNEPIGPTKAFWKKTHPSVQVCLKYTGVLSSPPIQGPRSMPGSVAGLSSGNTESSHSMLTSTSSQSEIAMTWPRSKDLPISAEPPFSE